MFLVVARLAAGSRSVRQSLSPSKPCWKNLFVFDLPIIDQISLLACSAHYRVYVHVASSQVHFAWLCSYNGKRSALKNAKTDYSTYSMVE